MYAPSTLPCARVVVRADTWRAIAIATSLETGGAVIAILILLGRFGGVGPSTLARRDLLELCASLHVATALAYRLRCPIALEGPWLRGSLAGAAHIAVAVAGLASAARFSTYEIGAFEVFLLGMLLQSLAAQDRNAWTIGRIVAALGYTLLTRCAAVIVWPALLLAYLATAATALDTHGRPGVS